MIPRPRPRPAAARRERGSVTIWSLAACIAIGLAGIAVTDAWRAISGWRRISAAADAAAVAGASGIDEDAYRTSGGHIVQLDPAIAERLALGSLSGQHDRGEITGGTATATTESVTVEVTGRVELPILGILPGQGPITMTATATATADPRPSD